MIHPKPGEVYWVDMGMRAKFRPLLVVSREDTDSERALCVCVPCTTQIKGGRYEVALPRVKWLPGSTEGVANVLGIQSIEYHRLDRRAGCYESSLIQKVRERIAWMLELEQPSA
jgi:mRNA interferase MazF